MGTVRLVIGIGRRGGGGRGDACGRRRQRGRPPLSAVKVGIKALLVGADAALALAVPSKTLEGSALILIWMCGWMWKLVAKGVMD